MTDDRHAYRTPAALRTALEDRLRRQAHDRTTFELRQTEWPPALLPPPST